MWVWHLFPFFESLNREKEEVNEEPENNSHVQHRQIPVLVSARMNELTTNKWHREKGQKHFQTGL